MKKSYNVLIAALVLALVFFLSAACGGSDGPSPTQPATQAPAQTPATPAPPPAEPDPKPPAAEPDPVPVVNFVPAPAPAGHIWSLSRDPAIQTQDIGTMGDGALLNDTEFLTNAGSPIFTIVESPFGGKGLELSFRTENWFALDLSSPAFNFNFNTSVYHIMMRGKVSEPEGTTIIIGGADNPWNWLISGAPEADGSFVLAGIISTETMDKTAGGAASGQFDRCIRIQTNNLVDLTVYEIVIVEASPGLIWSLSTDSAIQAQAVGTMGDGALLDNTAFLQNAGSPIFTIVESPYGGKGLELSFRTENWFALDLVSRYYKFDYENYAYHITLRGKVSEPEGTTVIIGGADNPWNWLIHGNPEANGDFFIQGLISTETMNATAGGAASGQFDRCIRIQTNNLVDLTIYEITVVSVAKNHVWSLSRDLGIQSLKVGTMGDESLLSKTAFLQNAGSPVFTVVESPLGGKGLGLSFRTENWFALDLRSKSFNFDYEKNNYHVVMTGKVAEPEGTTVIIGGADNPWNWLLNVSPEADGSFILEGDISTATMNATAGGAASGQFDRCIRIQTNNLVDFIIYDIVITK